MIFTLIAAVSENNAIGRNNELPWKLPEDLKFFKRTTLGKPVIMGRKTFEALGKPLPGRLNIVLSRNKELTLPDGVLLLGDISEATEYLENSEEYKDLEQAFIIGGGQVYQQAMPLAERMFITRVHTTVDDADAFFPVIDHTHWKLVWEEQHAQDEKHAYSFTFQQYERAEF